MKNFTYFIANKKSKILFFIVYLFFFNIGYSSNIGFVSDDFFESEKLSLKSKCQNVDIFKRTMPGLEAAHSDGTNEQKVFLDFTIVVSKILPYLNKTNLIRFSSTCKDYLTVIKPLPIYRYLPAYPSKKQEKKIIRKTKKLEEINSFTNNLENDIDDEFRPFKINPVELFINGNSDLNISTQNVYQQVFPKIKYVLCETFCDKDEFIDAIDSFSKIDEIHIKSSFLRNFIEAAILNYEEDYLEKITKLHFVGGNFKREIVNKNIHKCLNLCNQLKVLKIVHSKIDSDILIKIFPAAGLFSYKLTELNLHNNFLTSDSIKILFDSSIFLTLEKLDISDNFVDDLGLSYFKTLKKDSLLTEINMAHNLISAQGVIDFSTCQNLPFLKILNISRYFGIRIEKLLEDEYISYLYPDLLQNYKNQRRPIHSSEISCMFSSPLFLNLQILTMRDWNINDECVLECTLFLTKNKNLKEFHIPYNGITTNNLFIFNGVFMDNKKLEILDIKDNKIDLKSKKLKKMKKKGIKLDKRFFF